MINYMIRGFDTTLSSQLMLHQNNLFHNIYYQEIIYTVKQIIDTNKQIGFIDMIIFK